MSISVERLILGTEKQEFMLKYREVTDLCRTWWGETLFSKEFQIEFNPIEDFFLVQETRDRTFGVLLRDDETKQLVGVYIGMLNPFIFNKDKVLCTEVVWCIEKSNRGLSLGNKLMDEVDSALRELKVDIASLSIPNTKYLFACELIAKKHNYKRADVLSYKQISKEEDSNV